MARKDLAGLAALGALGMMLSKRKGKEDAGIDPESADRANAISRGRTDLVDTGMSTPEPGGRVRPDENYGNEGRRTGPVGVGKVPAATSNIVRASQLGSQKFPMTRGPRSADETVPVDTSRVSDMDLTGGARSPDQTGGQISRIKNLAGAFNVPMRQRVDEAGNPYKKGGAVKKMASGGMASSASKRADGIATKGKTRGKMC